MKEKDNKKRTLIQGLHVTDEMLREGEERYRTVFESTGRPL